MREITCRLCGQTAEAANDEALFQLGRQHINQAHPDVKVDDNQLRQIIQQDAHDKK
jgi:hypothetical protein